MIQNPDLKTALVALADCEAALRELHDACCEPGRSPRMEAVAGTLAEARTRLQRIGVDPGAGEATLEHLEDAGAQIGRLQVGCCAPSRLPLYARFLGDLTAAQRAVNRSMAAGD